jgi:hypothetical protein
VKYPFEECKSWTYKGYRIEQEGRLFKTYEKGNLIYDKSSSFEDAESVIEAHIKVNKYLAKVRKSNLGA